MRLAIIAGRRVVVKYLGWILAWTFLGMSPVYSEQTKFYVEMFSSHSLLNRPGAAHTFVRYFKVNPDGSTESFDISWLPAPGEARGLRGQRMPLIRQVPGHNYTVEETVAGLPRRRIVDSHGLTEISPEVYQQAVDRKNLLESGAVDYKVFDSRTKPNAMNCVSATQVTDGPNLGWKHGPNASIEVANQVSQASQPSQAQATEPPSHFSSPAPRPFFPRFRRR